MPVMTGIAELHPCTPDGAVIHDAAIAWQGETITWIGPESELPEAHASGLVNADESLAHARAETSITCPGRIVIPGLIDCHTHLAFGGWRADEFAARSSGASYQSIAAGGGGIVRTVQQTRAASDDTLRALCQRRLAAMRTCGVTTVECKSGYGLSVEHELRLLGIYRDLIPAQPTRLVSTLLAAHAIPPEFANRREAWLDEIVNTIIPTVGAEELAQFNDVFVEDGAFAPAETRRVLEAGRAVGLRPKLHVDQLGNGHGAALAAELGAISADHLEYTDDAGIAALAEAGTVAVTLPIASLYLRQPPLDARRFIDAGVPVAVATDFNPGSAPIANLPLAMSLACVMNHLTPIQALHGATRHAAAAIGMGERIGCLTPGRMADFVCLDVESIDAWLCRAGANEDGGPAPLNVCIGGAWIESEAF